MVHSFVARVFGLGSSLICRDPVFVGNTALTALPFGTGAACLPVTNADWKEGRYLLPSYCFYGQEDPWGNITE